MKSILGTVPVSALVLVAAIALIGVGYAYTAITENNNNYFSPDSYIYVTDEYGNPNIQIPSVEYSQSNDVWTTNTESKRIKINLDVEGGSDFRMLVWFPNSDMTWRTISELNLVVKKNGVETDYGCFVEDQGRSAVRPTPNVHVEDGQEYFIEVVYRTPLTADPSSFTGDNMSSKVIFIYSSSDPLTPSQ